MAPPNSLVFIVRCLPLLTLLSRHRKVGCQAKSSNGRANSEVRRELRLSADALPLPNVCLKFRVYVRPYFFIPHAVMKIRTHVHLRFRRTLGSGASCYGHEQRECIPYGTFRRITGEISILVLLIDSSKYLLKLHAACWSPGNLGCNLHFLLLLARIKLHHMDR